MKYLDGQSRSLATAPFNTGDIALLNCNRIMHSFPDITTCLAYMTVCDLKLGMLISNFSQIRISNVIIRSKSGYQISSELHEDW